MNTIQTDRAPKAIGPYAQAVLKNGTLYVSGQLGLDPATGVLEPTFEAQANRVLSNLEAILGAAGMGFADVVKATIFVKDLAQFGLLNELYGRRFQAPFPARETVEVARLPKDALVEISVIAVK